MRHDNRKAFEEWIEIAGIVIGLAPEWNKRDEKSGVYCDPNTAAYWLGWLGGWRTAWDTTACVTCGAEGFRLTDGLCDGCLEAHGGTRMPSGKYLKAASEAMQAAGMTHETHNA